MRIFCDKKNILFIIMVIAAALIGCNRHDGKSRMDLPNIILISLDTLRADHLHCYGYEKEISPAIDAMAAGGVLFEKAYAQSAWTLPSHVSMFTSLYPSSHGVTTRKRKIPENMNLLSEILKTRDYRTASFNGSLFVSAKFGFDKGFDLYEEIPIRKGDVATICNRMLSWIEENHQDPFFIFFHTYEIHRPFSPPDPYKEAYVPSEPFARQTASRIVLKVLEEEPLTLEEVGFLKALRFCRENETVFNWIKASEDHGDTLSDREIKMKLVDILATEYEMEDDVLADWRENKTGSPVYTYLLENYDAEIIFTDHQISRLMDLLRRLELQEKTLIVLTSDHGEEFSEHGGLGHGKTCYNEVIQVPLIFYFPGCLPAGTRIRTNAALIDLPPTILEVAGIDIPEAYQGISLLPLIEKPREIQRLIFSENMQEGATYWPVVVIDGDWKFHYDQKNNRPGELYHLGLDPGEVDNLAGTNHTVRDRLEVEVTAHLKKAQSTGIALTEQSGEIQRQLKALGYAEEEEESD